MSNIEHNFVKIQNEGVTGWWIKITNEFELVRYNECFTRKLYEYAFTNLVEGKEYNAPHSVGHGPHPYDGNLSYLAYMRAMRKNKPLPFGALEELGIIRNEKYEDMLKFLRSGKIIYANKQGGYHLAKNNEIEVESKILTDFPKEDTSFDGKE